MQIDDFLIGDMLGEGTFGKVKVATHCQTGEKVAVKVLSKKKIRENHDEERISREINILKKMMHPNIAQLYSVIETNQSLYLIMEYCESGELFHHIVLNRKLNESESSKLYTQLISGIEYLHLNGIVHRDLKPENILLHKSKLKIVDFGLSNTYKTGQKLITACGSPSYAAPEMILGNEYEGLGVDLWSSGIILYAMVCGCLPFEDSTADEETLFKKIVSGKFILPKYLSNQVKDLLSKILVTDPKKRIKLEDIKKHPWLNSGNFSILKSPGLFVGKISIPIDFKIVEELEEMKFSKEEIIESVRKNRHNKITTCYYLLVKKKVNLKIDSISDFSGKVYVEYFNNYYKNDNNENSLMLQNKEANELNKNSNTNYEIALTNRDLNEKREKVDGKKNIVNNEENEYSLKEKRSTENKKDSSTIIPTDVNKFTEYNYNVVTTNNDNFITNSKTNEIYNKKHKKYDKEKIDNAVNINTNKTNHYNNSQDNGFDIDKKKDLIVNDKNVEEYNKAKKNSRTSLQAYFNKVIHEDCSNSLSKSKFNKESEENIFDMPSVDEEITNKPKKSIINPIKNIKSKESINNNNVKNNKKDTLDSHIISINETRALFNNSLNESASNSKVGVYTKKQLLNNESKKSNLKLNDKKNDNQSNIKTENNNPKVSVDPLKINSSSLPKKVEINLENLSSRNKKKQAQGNFSNFSTVISGGYLVKQIQNKFISKYEDELNKIHKKNKSTIGDDTKDKKSSEPTITINVNNLKNLKLNTLNSFVNNVESLNSYRNTDLKDKTLSLNITERDNFKDRMNNQVNALNNNINTIGNGNFSKNKVKNDIYDKHKGISSLTKNYILQVENEKTKKNGITMNSAKNNNDLPDYKTINIKRFLNTNQNQTTNNNDIINNNHINNSSLSNLAKIINKGTYYKRVVDNKYKNITNNRKEKHELNNKIRNKKMLNTSTVSIKDNYEICKSVEKRNTFKFKNEFLNFNPFKKTNVSNIQKLVSIDINDDVDFVRRKHLESNSPNRNKNEIYLNKSQPATKKEKLLRHKLMKIKGFQNTIYPTSTNENINNKILKSSQPKQKINSVISNKKMNNEKQDFRAFVTNMNNPSKFYNEYIKTGHYNLTTNTSRLQEDKKYYNKTLSSSLPHHIYKENRFTSSNNMNVNNSNSKSSSTNKNEDKNKKSINNESLISTYVKSFTGYSSSLKSTSPKLNLNKESLRNEGEKYVKKSVNQSVDIKNNMNSSNKIAKSNLSFKYDNINLYANLNTNANNSNTNYNNLNIKSRSMSKDSNENTNVINKKIISNVFHTKHINSNNLQTNSNINNNALIMNYLNNITKNKGKNQNSIDLNKETKNEIALTENINYFKSEKINIKAFKSYLIKKEQKFDVSTYSQINILVFLSNLKAYLKELNIDYQRQGNEWRFTCIKDDISFQIEFDVGGDLNVRTKQTYFVSWISFKYFEGNFESYISVCLDIFSKLYKVVII